MTDYTMSKYIDAERLKCELEKRLKNVHDYMNGAGMKYKGPKYYKAQGKESAYDALLSVIDSLQQEQPDIDDIKREWYNKGYLKGRKESNIPARELGLPKSCDMQEQSKVDLEKEMIIDYVHNHYHYDKDFDGYGHSNLRPVFTREDLVKLARHFYELGLNAKK